MWGHKVDASTNNIPNSYSSAAGSYMFQAPSSGILMIFHNVTEPLVITWGAYNEVPTTSITDNRKQLYIPPASSASSYTGWVMDAITVTDGDKVYIRNDGSGSVSTGKVYINLVGQRR